MSGRVRGWCPTVFEPMETGDGWLVRVRPRQSALSVDQAYLLAKCARTLGNGIIDITSRGSVQLRGFTQESAETFAQLALAAGLANSDPLVERRRAIIMSPLADVDPDCQADTVSLVDLLESKLRHAVGLEKLPSKTGFVVDGGGVLPLGGVKTDFMLRADGGAWTLRVGEYVCRADNEALCDVIIKMAQHSAATGVRVMRADASSLFDAIDTKLPFTHCPNIEQSIESVGIFCGETVLGVGVRFGSMEALTLERLADIAAQNGDGTIRVTPWRSILVAGDVDRMVQAMMRIGPDIILDPHDPVRRVVACPGAPACASATTDTRRDAMQFAPFLPKGQNAHVSGCPKGCAQQSAADIVLVGEAGKYALVHHGRAQDQPSISRQTIDQIGTVMHDMAHRAELSVQPSPSA